MARSLSFLHTSPVHIQTFDALLTELAPDIPARHIVDTSLLHEACASGGVTFALRERVEKTLLSAIEAQDAAVMVCTCSSIGSVAEAVNGRTHATLMRIDRPMATEAVVLGSRIIVAATLSTTLIPTRELILSVARQTGKEVQIIELLCDSAWRQFEQGNQEAYLREVADNLQNAATQGDVIVLAQASMARAVELCSELALPVLTSPRSGLLAAIKAYREREVPHVQGL
jgi:hypothetical protein